MISLCAALIAATVNAAPIAPTIPKPLAEIEAKYAAAGTLQADFTQVEKNVLLNRDKTSSGTLQVKRPNKLRWETLKPDKNLLVSNGKIFWFYTPPFDPEDKTEQGELIERKSSQVNSKMMNALISGAFSQAKGVKITQKSESSYELAFKKNTAGTISKALVLIDSKDQVIREVELEHAGGNRSRISLSSIKLGEKIPDDTFEFKAPPNTHRAK